MLKYFLRGLKTTWWLLLLLIGPLSPFILNAIGINPMYFAYAVFLVLGIIFIYLFVLATIHVGRSQ